MNCWNTTRTVLSVQSRRRLFFHRGVGRVDNTGMSMMVRRSLTSKPPGRNPLDVLRKESMARNLCDEDGSRLPGVHWVLALAMAPPPPDLHKPPNLRTVGIERISAMGIDFVLKRGSYTASAIAAGQPVSMLSQQGRFLHGEHSEQWRGEGSCQTLPLGEILDLIPNFVVTSMVASTRIAREDGSASTDHVSDGRLAMVSRSHVTEVFQKTRIALENGDIPMDELENCMAAFRFRPDRMECMIGGPDSIMWDRWEWNRISTGVHGGGEDSVHEKIEWDEAKHLVPH